MVKSLTLNGILNILTSTNVKASTLNAIMDLLLKDQKKEKKSKPNTKLSKYYIKSKTLENDETNWIKTEQIRLDSDIKQMQDEQVYFKNLPPHIEPKSKKSKSKKVILAVEPKPKKSKKVKKEKKEDVVCEPISKPRTGWIDHVKAYAAKHEISYRDAMSAARESYVKPEKVKVAKAPKVKIEKLKPEKIAKIKPIKYSKSGKEKQIFQCEFCKFNTTDKSNYNRHFKRHIDKKQLMMDLMEARGLIKRHGGRARTSKNKDIRIESQLIYDDAIKRRDTIIDILKKIESGDFKKITKIIKTSNNKSAEVVERDELTTKIPKYIDNLIERINYSYDENNKIKLKLTKDKITGFKKTGDTILLKVTKITVDDGEDIDSIELVKDEKLDGYNATLLQDADIKGKIQSLEYDNLYVY
jgi:hypothetical protein